MTFFPLSCHANIYSSCSLFAFLFATFVFILPFQVKFYFHAPFNLLKIHFVFIFLFKLNFRVVFPLFSHFPLFLYLNIVPTTNISWYPPLVYCIFQNIHLSFLVFQSVLFPMFPSWCSWSTVTISWWCCHLYLLFFHTVVSPRGFPILPHVIATKVFPDLPHGILLSSLCPDPLNGIAT